MFAGCPVGVRNHHGRIIFVGHGLFRAKVFNVAMLKVGNVAFTIGAPPLEGPSLGEVDLILDALAPIQLGDFDWPSPSILLSQIRSRCFAIFDPASPNLCLWLLELYADHCCWSLSLKRSSKRCFTCASTNSR